MQPLTLNKIDTELQEFYMKHVSFKYENCFYVENPVS
jgi:hypothetical protein